MKIPAVLSKLHTVGDTGSDEARHSDLDGAEQRGMASLERDGIPREGWHPQRGISSPDRDHIPRQGSHPQTGITSLDRDHIPKQGSHPQRGITSSIRDLIRVSPFFLASCHCNVYIIITYKSTWKLLYNTPILRNYNTFDTIYEWWGYDAGCF